MVGGPVAGLRGNNHKVDLHQRGGAQVATTGVPVHRGQTHRPNARGTRAKPQTNTTAAIGKRKFDGLAQQGDPKRRFGIGNGGSWGSQPLPQQPLNGAEQWYTDTYPAWS